MIATARRKSSPPTNGRPKYQPLPDLPADEFEALKADIAENGLQYPVIQDELGNTLDGHQRERALKELKVKNYPIKVMSGLTDEQKWHFALSVNVKRRSLTTAQKRALIEAELRRTPDIANQWLGEILGMDTKTVQAARARLESTLEIPVLKKLRGKDGRKRSATYVLAQTPGELVRAREIIHDLPESERILDAVSAQRHARRHLRAEARNDKRIKSLGDDSIKIHHCPFQRLEQVAGIRPKSVDLILTDFPFGKEFLPQLPDLAALAGRALKEGGLFVTFTGQYWLPQVMEAFGKHLTYRWLAMSSWDGDSNLIHPLDLASQCKPILVYSKGAWTKRDRWGDTFFAANKEKKWHPWQQSLDEVERLVRYFSQPGDLVIDPCGGGFTTAVACYNLGRRCISCDADRQCVRKGQQRLAEILGGANGKRRS